MRATPRFLALLATLLVVTGAGLGWQRRTAGALREQIARQRARAEELARLQAEHRRLVAAQPTEDELAELLANQVAAEQLRAQLAAMRRREQELTQAGAPEEAASSSAAPSLKGNSVGFKLWRNAGQATPDAAFETALWAAAAGDLDALADVLALDPEGRNQAAAAFAGLPAAVQNELGTPERLVALLTAMEVPLGRASILRQVPTPAGTRVSAQLIDAEGKSKTAVFTLQATDDRWRLAVPASAIAKYDHWLRAAANSSTVLK